MLGYLILLCWSEALLNNVHVLMTSVAENSLIQKYSHFCPFVTDFLPKTDLVVHLRYFIVFIFQLEADKNERETKMMVCRESVEKIESKLRPVIVSQKCCTSAGLINYTYLHHCQGAISLQVNKSKQSYQRTKAPNQTNVKVITYWRKKHLYLTMHKLLPWK